MQIGGFQKLSFIDFPETIASVVFTQGCNWRCPWCHNPGLVYPEQFDSPIPEEEIFSYLVSRKKYIEGVVVSGGEPTLQADLPDFLERVRELGFKTKLDTNGSRPSKLAELLDRQLLDFVAMDIKSAPETYSKLIGVSVDIRLVEESVHRIKSSGLPYQFRTTHIPHIHTEEDLTAVEKLAGEPVLRQEYSAHSEG
jgi:pyruvate formate lyase activating enzyme